MIQPTLGTNPTAVLSVTSSFQNHVLLLKKHDRTHTRHEPFRCSQCDFEFFEFSWYPSNWPEKHRTTQLPAISTSCSFCTLKQIFGKVSRVWKFLDQPTLKTHFYKLEGLQKYHSTCGSASWSPVQLLHRADYTRGSAPWSSSWTAAQPGANCQSPFLWLKEEFHCKSNFLNKVTFTKIKWLWRTLVKRLLVIRPFICYDQLFHNNSKFWIKWTFQK